MLFNIVFMVMRNKTIIEIETLEFHISTLTYSDTSITINFGPMWDPPQHQRGRRVSTLERIT